MSILSAALRGGLWLLIIVGVWSSLQLSFLTITGTAPCPNVFEVPLCYLAAIGYLSMLASQVSPSKTLRHRLFYPAWSLVFLIATSGTSLEIFVGDACPRTAGGLPMCYISLAFCTTIFVLYHLESWLSGNPCPS